MKEQTPNWPHGVSLKPALQQALESMAKVSPPIAASRGGCDCDDNRIKVPFFHHVYMVHPSELRVVEENVSSHPPWGNQLVVLHYLLNGDGTPPSGLWVTYRHIPDAFLFEPRFNAMAIQPLIKAFGTDLKGFRKAAESISGIEMTRSGDAAYRFLALPQIPMGCILYLADEELQASVSILFDGAAANYLCAEDLAYLGIYLSKALLQTAHN